MSPETKTPNTPSFRLLRIAPEIGFRTKVLGRSGFFSLEKPNRTNVRSVFSPTTPEIVSGVKLD